VHPSDLKNAGVFLFDEEEAKDWDSYAEHFTDPSHWPND